MPLNPAVLLYGLAPKLTSEQRAYVDAIHDKQIVFSNSISGSGKTTLAVAMAHYLVKTGKYDSALYVFAPVEEDKMGYRPGNQREKEDIYISPLRDALVEIGLQPEKEIIWSDEDRKSTNKWIEVTSHTFQRGINLKNRVVIIDEAQNFTKPQLKKVLTRAHDTCKVIVIGHSGQIDLPNTIASGFVPYLEHFKPEVDHCAVVNLTKNFRGFISTHADKLA